MQVGPSRAGPAATLEMLAHRAEVDLDGSSW